MAIKVPQDTIADLTSQRDTAQQTVTAEQDQIEQATARRDAAASRRDALTKILAGLEVG